jgi:hypothetical protein
MKKLPVGIQSFQEIIRGDYVYADKTRYIHSLISDYQYCFLSRPRRFGKSLLVDTMSAVFSGEKDLFGGLWIGGSGYDFKKYPVVRIDMSLRSAKDAGTLEESLLCSLKSFAESEGLSLRRSFPADAFEWLIVSLRKKYGERVVVLVDEYDKPILDHISNPETAKANREVLGGLSMRRCLRFCSRQASSLFAPSMRNSGQEATGWGFRT